MCNNSIVIQYTFTINTAYHTKWYFLLTTLVMSLHTFTLLMMIRNALWTMILLYSLMFSLFTNNNNIIINHLHDMFHLIYSTLRDGGKCFNYYKYCIMYILRFILSVLVLGFFVFFLNLSLFWQIYIFWPWHCKQKK